MREPTKRFAFIAHWVEPWNWLLWWSKDLHMNPQHACYWKWLAPFYWGASLEYLVGKKKHDVVDEFTFNGNLKGQTILIRNFGWHFFVKNCQQRIRERILDAVLLAQKGGANVVGLGALTKAEWLTNGGQWIVDELSDKLHIPVIHGDTLTAASVVMQAERVAKKLKAKPFVFITGATSKIGRAVAIELARRDYKIVMYTKSRIRFESIQSEASGFGSNIIHATSLSEGASCSLWITGKAVPGGTQLLEKIPDGAVVLNFSVPNPISAKYATEKPSIFFQEAGLLAYHQSCSDLKFTMRLRPGITYACHAATIVHASQGWTNHEVGQIHLPDIWAIWKAATDVGFHLPPLDFS